MNTGGKTIDAVILAARSLIDSGQLTPENNKALQILSAELVNTWEKRQVFRTETEMQISVLNDEKHPTSASKYWQAVREQANMLDNLTVVGFDYRRNEVKIKQLKKRLENESDEFEYELLQIDLDECLYKRASLQQNANDRVRELRLWSQIKAELDDGSFDTQDVNAHQHESFILALNNRRRALTQGSSQAEVINVMGPLKTAIRLKNEATLQKG